MFKAKNQIVLIIGCGRLGAALAGLLSERNCVVTVIDREKPAFDRLPPSFSGAAVTGDAADVNTLVAAGVGEADAVILMTGNDNVNLFVAQIAKEIYRTPKVVSRLSDPEREAAYGAFGVRALSASLFAAKDFAEEVIS